MITDGYWRLELFHNKQKIIFWSLIDNTIMSEHNEHRVSREILYSAVAIRKVIDDDKEFATEATKINTEKLPLEVMNLKVPIKRIPFNGDKDFILHKFITDNYDYSKTEKIEMDINYICNQIIHSYVWSVVYSNKKLFGVLFASDTKKDKEIYLLKIEDWLEVLQFCVEKATV